MIHETPERDPGSTANKPATGGRLPELSPSLQDAERRVAAALAAAGVFCGHGTDNHADEACWLVRGAAGLSVQEALSPDHELTAEQLQRIERWLQQRIDQRLPLAYLAGRAWFAGLEFLVNDQVLVPRSPIGELIEAGMPLWDLGPGARLLDLCTGSGCIAIALAHHLPLVEVVGSDIDSRAVALARENARRRGVADRCHFVCGDLFDAVPHRFDLVVSNPPYVGAAEYAALPPEYHREPGLGLKSGVDGLDIPLQILSQSPDYLTSDGALVLEVGASAEALLEQLPTLAFTWLEFERGGDGVLTASAAELMEWRPVINNLIQSRADHGK